MSLIRAVASRAAVGVSVPATGARALSTTTAAESKAMGINTSHGAWFLERGTKPAHRMEEMYDFLDQDVPYTMHKDIDRHRVLTNYARLVENELPRLSQFATPFRAPAKYDFLRLRTMHYQGAEKKDPLVLKARIDFPVDKLFASGLLPTKQARKKFLQLADTRYDPSRTDRLNHLPGTDKPPARSLTPMTWDEVLDNGLGWVKISCSRFPNVNQNIKFVFDRFDEMIAESTREPYFDDLPINIRHVTTSQKWKNKLKRANGPTFKTFPQTWLSKTDGSEVGGYPNHQELTAEPWAPSLPRGNQHSVPENVKESAKLGFPVSLAADGEAALALAAKKRLPWTPEQYRAAVPGTEAVAAVGGRPKTFVLAENQQPAVEAPVPAAPYPTGGDPAP